MLKVNYVIASYGKNVRQTKYQKFPPPDQTLIEHLKSLLEFQNNLYKITILKPNIDIYDNQQKLFYDEYYNINNLIKQFDIKVEIFETKNECYSFGQFIDAFKIDDGESDFFICTEDDFLINRDNFDDYLYKNYYFLFKNNLGVLTNHVNKSSYNLKNLFFYIYNIFFKRFKIYPLNFFNILEGIIVINKQTILYLFENYDDIKLEMKKLNIKNNSIFGLFKNKDNEFIGYPGGYYQTAISYLFNKINIPIKPMDKNLQLTFWWDEKNDSLRILNRQNADPLKYLNKIESTYFIPIQLKEKYKKENIAKYKTIEDTFLKGNN